MRHDYTQVNDLEELLWYSVFFTDVENSFALSLFHYTDVSNKQHILKKKCIDLRLTRADCFEDIHEGKHIIEVFQHAITECRKNNLIDFTFANTLLSVKSVFSEICDKLRKYYVFCFSKNYKNDYLIKNYACKNNGAGIVIGFQALDIERLDEMKFQNQYPVSLIDVLYDKQDLSCYMQSLICRMYHLRAQDDNELSTCKKIALNQLVIYSLAYKSSEFKHEEETRLIVDFSCVDPQCDRIKADTNNNYIHVLMEKHSLYDIREVTT